MKSVGVRASILSCAVALALAGCGASDSEQASQTAEQAAKLAELEAREQQLAQREAELKQVEEARLAEIQAAEMEAAARELAAQEAAAKEAATEKAAQQRHAAASSASRTPAASTPKPVATQLPLEVPAGTQLVVALDSELWTKTAKVGDTFTAHLVSDLAANGRRVAASGSRVTGTVTSVVSGSSAIGAVPTLGLRFERLDLGDGRSVPIHGEIQHVGQSEKGRDAAKIIGGAAAGAVIGHQVKHGTKGQVIGGILGGAAGAVVARNTGTEVQLPAGSQLTLALSEGFVVASR